MIYMKKRPALLIKMCVLTELRDGPLDPTRLARVCNIPFDRLSTYLDPLLVKELIRKEFSGGHELYHLKPDGLQVLKDFELVIERVTP